MARVWSDNTGIPINAANLNGMEADIASKMPKWQANTVYALGALVVNPSGEIVKAIAAFTSGATYDAVNWAPTISVGALTTRVTSAESKNTAQDMRLDNVESANTAQDGQITGQEGRIDLLDVKSVDTQVRPLIGARAGSGSGVSLPDAEYFDLLHVLETDMKTDLDISSWYRSIGYTSAADFTATVASELAAYPDRKILYVFEIHKNNAQFNMEFSNQIGVYPHLLATLQAIKDSGFEDRVFLAPFHEGNGGGGSADESRVVTDGVLNSTTTITSATAAFVSGDVGSIVTGTGIPSGTTIDSVTNATTVVLSDAATATATGVNLTITNPGSNGAYPWQMYDVKEGKLYTPYADNFKAGVEYGSTFRFNSPTAYQQAFQNVVNLARSIGLKSKFVQWFLAANSGDSLTVYNIERMDLTPGYAGDAYADLIGLSYYNRSGDSRYSFTWPQPGGNGLREFYNAFESMTSNPMWICETGCADDNAYGKKASWYSDLIKLVGSDELPRIHGMVMFLQDSRKTVNGNLQGANMRLDTLEQRRMVGRAVKSVRRPTPFNLIPELNRNVLPVVVADLTTTAGWTWTSGAGMSVSNDYTPNLDIMVNGMHVTKPAWTTGDAHKRTSFTAYRSINSAYVDYEINAPYVLSFWARASEDGFRIEAGIRQDGGAATMIGDELTLSPYWEQYIIPFASMTADLGSWRIPSFSFGNNTYTYSTWFEVAQLRLSRGTEGQANVERLFRPRARTTNSAANLTWNCEAANIYAVTLAQNTTLMAPYGQAYDGQELTLKVTQDATGGRTVNLHADYYSGSINPTMATGPGAKNLLKFQYDADGGRWGLVSNSIWNLT